MSLTHTLASLVVLAAFGFVRAAPAPDDTEVDVFKCPTKTVFLDFFGTVRKECERDDYCATCEVVTGEGTCKDYTNYLAKCTVESTSTGRVPLPLTKMGIKGVLSGAFSEGCETVTDLDLKPDISSIPTGLFDHMPNVNQMQVGGTFTSLPADLFKENTQLAKLTIKGPVDATTVGNGTFKIPTLRNLLLQDWSIGAYDGSLIKDLPQLKLLYIENSGITSLTPKAFAVHKKLSELYIRGNKELTTLPAGLLNSTSSLKWVDFRDNGITAVPKGLLKKQKKLGQLSLSGNKIASLPDDFVSANPELRSINLQNNQITSLPAKFVATNPALGELWLENNKLTSLPTDLLKNNPSVSVVYLQNNCIETAPKDVFMGPTDFNFVLWNPQSCDSALTCDYFTLPKGGRCITADKEE